MHPFDNDEIVRLLRLKRYQQPPASYYENFLSEFRRRSAANCFVNRCGVFASSAHGFALRHNVRPYPAGGAVVVTCAAVISIRIYQQPERAQFALQSLPVPNPPANTEREPDLTPPVMIPSFNVEPTFLPRNTGYSVAAG
jgi:hypothetical protein